MWLTMDKQWERRVVVNGVESVDGVVPIMCLGKGLREYEVLQSSCSFANLMFCHSPILMIIPEPAHSVYKKTCQYVKTKWWRVTVNKEFQPDIEAIKKYINKNIIMVLCLDECTTNVDTKTTTKLKDAIPSEHEGLTVIIISEGPKEHHISRYVPSWTSTGDFGVVLEGADSV
ncbi:sphingosine-1-phosphate lyase [Tanacetum coccineum]